MIQAVFLDIDGTLLDFDACVKQALKTGFTSFGLKAYEPFMFDEFTRINNALWEQIEQGSLTFEDLLKVRFQTVFEALQISFNGETFELYFREFIRQSAIPVKGAMELLQYLQRKYLLCSASNGPYNQQLHRLELAGMKDYFDYHFISEQTGAEKPDKRFFETAFAAINTHRAVPLLPAESIIIGDSLTGDILGAGQMGMQSVWVNLKKQENLRGIEPDYEIQSLEQIKEIL